MTTISHKNLTTTQLHENKGVSTATTNTVATASSGATVWQKLTASHLTGTGNAFGAQLLHAQVTTSSGTGGGNATTGAWTKRTLDTSTLTNEISSASISSGVISLPAGTYYAEGSVEFYGTITSKTRLRDTSSGTTLVIGSSIYAANNGTSILSGRFTLAGTKNVELQYWATANVSNSMGQPVTSGEVEKYATLKIWKVA